MPAYPRFLTDTQNGLSSTISVYNLREVGPKLYVGAMASPVFGVPFRWGRIFDFYGSSRDPHNAKDYPAPVECFAFTDGEAVPVEALDRVYEVLKTEKKPVLLHCAMGLSRSAAVAYAMLRCARLDHETALRRVEVESEPGYPLPATLLSARLWAHSQRRTS